VPFVGAAAVWGTASLYLLFFVKDTWSAAGLALWGLCVVSTVDNIIKPIVLHGQSKLHPLLALLSVLGGVGALGPIGIFVGPIAVAFLQAALTMLQTELDSLGEGASIAGLETPGNPSRPPELHKPVSRG
jgi:predicted PurR-regulated permease PerM